jgi:hypothetical protein
VAFLGDAQYTQSTTKTSACEEAVPYSLDKLLETSKYGLGHSHFRVSHHPLCRMRNNCQPRRGCCPSGTHYPLIWFVNPASFQILCLPRELTPLLLISSPSNESMKEGESEDAGAGSHLNHPTVLLPSMKISRFVADCIS